MGESRTVLTNANLLDGNDAAKPGQTLVVEGNRIASVGEAPVQTGESDRVVDLAGRTVMPGMISCHFHTGFGPAPNQAPPVLGLDAAPAYMGMIAAYNARIALQAGVTSIIGSSNGELLDVCLKEAMILGIAEGPRILPCTRELMASGDMADGTNRSWYMEPGRLGLVRRADGAEQLRQAIREEIGRGCEVVKVSASPGHGSHPTSEVAYYTDEEFQVAADTAHELGALIRAHCPAAKTILSCAKAGYDIIDHADKIDDAGIEAVLAADASITPSLLWSVRYIGFAESWDHSAAPFPIGDGFPEPLEKTLARLDGVKRDFEYTAGMLPKLHAAGVRLVCGDDFGFPMMPHGDYVSEYEVYTGQIGIPALDVVRWATKNGAEAMHRADELGTLEPGKLADLLIVEGDPSEDVSVLRSGIVSVMKDGAWARDGLA